MIANKKFFRARLSFREERGISQSKRGPHDLPSVINQLVQDASIISECKSPQMDRSFYVYMMTNRSRVVLYTGVTNSLEVRLWFHANAGAKSFTKRYKVDRLVYYEEYDNPSDAIAREKEIKAWRREKKNRLVETLNPNWDDLRSQLYLA